MEAMEVQSQPNGRVGRLTAVQQQRFDSSVVQLDSADRSVGFKLRVSPIGGGFSPRFEDLESGNDEVRCVGKFNSTSAMPPISSEYPDRSRPTNAGAGWKLGGGASPDALTVSGILKQTTSNAAPKAVG